jgi:hypothetical protein
MTVDPGFAIENVQALSIQLPDGLLPAARPAKARDVRNALNATDLAPVALSDIPPFDGSNRALAFRYPHEGRELSRVFLVRGVSENYFEVLNISLVAGRAHTDDATRHEIVVSESAARQLWPDDNAIGKRLLSGSSPAAAPRGQSQAVAGVAATTPESPADAYEVVGVAKDVPIRSLDEIEPVVYLAATHVDPKLLVKTSSPTLRERVTPIVEAIVPGARLSVSPLTENVRNSLSQLEFGSRVAWSIGLLALVLATIGAFGVFAYMVEERRREIGIRMALGARAPEVIRLVLHGASRPIVIGLGAGLVLSIGGGLLLRSALYGMSPFDPIAYAQIAAILTLAATIATWIPARRATRIDPTVALRAD